MWKTFGNNLLMTVGDFGVPLPARFTGTDLTAFDRLKYTFKAHPNGSTILEKEYTPVENVFALELTAAESALFPEGQYVYNVDWYQNGEFMCNIVPIGIFKVVEKA